jgi:hypothetical protein
MKVKIIMLFLLIFCSVPFSIFGQVEKKKSIEDTLIGTWELVPGVNDSAATFNVTYLESLTYYFSDDHKLKINGNVSVLHGDWKLDNDNNLVIKLIDEDKQEENYLFKFNKLTFDTCILEAIDEEPGDGDEPTRMRIKKLSEK